MFPIHDLPHHTARAVGRLAVVLALLLAYGKPLADDQVVCLGALSSASALQTAMRNATPGTTILLAPGVYVGSKSGSGDPSSKGCFYSGRSGTSSAPIVIRSCDPAHPAVLSGSSVKDDSYVLHLTGDWWEVRDVVVTNGQKGVVIDHGNHNLLWGIDVHRVGDEGVHFRDGSSYNYLSHSRIHDTGNYQPGFGEGAYVGSDYASSYQHHVIGNVIHDTRFDGDITAEHVDIKEGADGTVVEFCSFDATGITGSNSGDCFIDVKGVNSVIRYNRGDRKRNAKLSDAFQVSTHGSGYPTGRNNRFSRNTLDLDDCSGYVVNAASGTASTTAQEDVRVGGGHLYTANVMVTPATPVGGPPDTYPLAVAVTPNPSSGPVTFACEIDHAGEGEVTVFDVAGRRVAEVARGSFPAGRQVWQWDARVANGERAGRGIYFVRMAVNQREVVQRFTLTR
jgi:flagellar hook capping protein FlgD